MPVSWDTTVAALTMYGPGLWFSTMTSLMNIRRYWSSALGLLVAGLAVAAKYYKTKAKKQKKRADRAVAQVKHDRAVAEGDNELEGQFRSRRAEAVKEIKTKGSTKELSEPNKW